MISIAPALRRARDRAAGEARHEHVGMPHVGPHGGRPPTTRGASRSPSAPPRTAPSPAPSRAPRSGTRSLRSRSTIITFSARSFDGGAQLGRQRGVLGGRRAAAARALDRPRLAAVALDAQEQLGRDRRDRGVARLQVGGVVARARPPPGARTASKPSSSHGTSSTCARLTSNSSPSAIRRFTSSHSAACSARVTALVATRGATARGAGRGAGPAAIASVSSVVRGAGAGRAPPRRRRRGRRPRTCGGTMAANAGTTGSWREPMPSSPSPAS